MIKIFHINDQMLQKIRLWFHLLKCLFRDQTSYNILSVNKKNKLNVYFDLNDPHRPSVPPSSAFWLIRSTNSLPGFFFAYNKNLKNQKNIYLDLRIDNYSLKTINNDHSIPIRNLTPMFPSHIVMQGMKII